MDTFDTLEHIELDIAFEAHEDLAYGLVAITEDHPDVMYRIVTLDGPAAHWPVVRFEAARDALLAFVTDYCGGDRTEALELLDGR